MKRHSYDFKTLHFLNSKVKCKWKAAVIQRVNMFCSCMTEVLTQIETDFYYNAYALLWSVSICKENILLMSAAHLIFHSILYLFFYNISIPLSSSINLSSLSFAVATSAKFLMSFNPN